MVLKNVFYVMAICVLLISILFLSNKNNNSSTDSTISLNRKILFQQPSESTRAKHILVHIPEKEIFMSTLHPAASLYEDVTDEVKVKECFDNLVKIIKTKKYRINYCSIRFKIK